MSSWKLSLRATTVAAIALVAVTNGIAAPRHTPPARQEKQEQAAPPPGNVSGYGVKLGGFFDEKHHDVAKKAYAQHYAKAKECPKDMERKGKTCRALVQGHYWVVGQPLRKEVETFALPEDVQAKLPAAPEGYEYVRAGEDVLLVSKGLHLVVDMMEDVAG